MSVWYTGPNDIVLFIKLPHFVTNLLLIPINNYDHVVLKNNTAYVLEHAIREIQHFRIFYVRLSVRISKSSFKPCNICSTIEFLYNWNATEDDRNFDSWIVVLHWSICLTQRVQGHDVSWIVSGFIKEK